MAIQSSKIDAVQWYEGMLLTPQLFQQADVRVEELQQIYASAVNPFFYGVTEYAFDAVKLGHGLLQITSLKAIFPDGLVYQYVRDNLTELTLDLTVSRAQFQTGPQIISLAVPLRKPLDANVSGDFPRYSASQEDAAVDTNTGDNLIHFPRLHPNVSLIVGPVPTRFTAIPLMTITLNQETFVNVDTFTPPYITLSNQSGVGSLIYGLITEMRGKVNYLFQKQTAYLTTYGGAQKDQRDLGPLLRVLAACLLELEAFYYTQHMNPFSLYAALCKVVGHLAPLRPSDLLPFLGGYEHRDQYGSFNTTIQKIRSLLLLIQKNYDVHPFTLSTRYFSLDLVPSWLAPQQLYVGIRLSNSMRPNQAMTWLDEVVIGTEDKIQDIQEKRMLGAPRQLVDADTQVEFSLTPDTIMIQVNIDPEFITSGKKLYVFNISDTEANRPRELLLFVPTAPLADTQTPPIATIQSGAS